MEKSGFAGCFFLANGQKRVPGGYSAKPGVPEFFHANRVRSNVSPHACDPLAFLNRDFSVACIMRAFYIVVHGENHTAHDRSYCVIREKFSMGY